MSTSSISNGNVDLDHGLVPCHGCGEDSILCGDFHLLALWGNMIKRTNDPNDHSIVGVYVPFHALAKSLDSEDSFINIFLLMESYNNEHITAYLGNVEFSSSKAEPRLPEMNMATQKGEADLSLPYLNAPYNTPLDVGCFTSHKSEYGCSSTVVSGTPTSNNRLKDTVHFNGSKQPTTRKERASSSPTMATTFGNAAQLPNLDATFNILFDTPTFDLLRFEDFSEESVSTEKKIVLRQLSENVEHRGNASGGSRSPVINRMDGRCSDVERGNNTNTIAYLVDGALSMLDHSHDNEDKRYGNVDVSEMDVEDYKNAWKMICGKRSSDEEPTN
ncbi:hypothetical protein Sjap_012907 [Stephania japonica]|uniref:Uncharacterized protein n=1 Tax=Stephania japonica TaxID=461633 RepID=A0AAP0IXR1_9MAGN